MNTTTTLTPEDIAAIKAFGKSRNTSIVCAFGSSDIGVDPTYIIRLACDDRVKDRMGREVEINVSHEMTVDGAIQKYDTNGTTTRVSCVDLYASSDQLSAYPLLRQARANDTLYVTFQLGNDTEYLKNAGLHHDSCFITLIRKGKNMGTSLVRSQVTPNNSARMAWS